MKSGSHRLRPLHGELFRALVRLAHCYQPRLIESRYRKDYIAQC